MMKYAVLLLLAASATVHGETYEELVERAFGSMEQDVHTNWAFTETRTNGEGTFLATFDPGRDEQWLLVSVDGREPTEKELEEFQADKAQDRDSDEGRGEANVAEDSLELVEETDDYFVCSFVPGDDEDEDAAFMKFVQATLTVMKDGPYVSEISMKNDGPIKPGKGVKIKKFKTRLEFAPAEAGGPALPQKVEVEVKGRAMLVIGFDEKESVEFSNYRRAVAAPSM